MSLETAQSDRSANAARPVNNRAKLTNRPRSFPISLRSALGRRLRDLADSYATELGGWPKLTDTMAANVRRAAELTALSEQSRAVALRDGCSDPLVLVRLDGAADRARRALGLPTGTIEPKSMTLAQYAAAKYGPPK